MIRCRCGRSKICYQTDTVTLTYPDPIDGIWGRLASELVEAAARTGITIQADPLSSYGGHSRALAALKSGAVDIAAFSGILLAQSTEEFELLNLRFLAMSLPEARRIVAAVHDDLQSVAEADGLHVLGYMPSSMSSAWMRGAP